MTTVNATEAKNRFGQIIEQARKEPVVVQSHGRDAVVILDHAEFARLRRLEDAYWVARAEEAIQNGFLSPEETVARLKARYEAAEEG
jgi:prevent-host-death family protein